MRARGTVLLSLHDLGRYTRRENPRRSTTRVEDDTCTIFTRASGADAYCHLSG